MPSAAAVTIYAFGLTALLAGIISLADSYSSSSSPMSPTSQLGLPQSCIPATRGNGLAAIAMGLYYSLAAHQENTAFFLATVPMRLLSTVVFWTQGWWIPAVWEGGAAVLTGVAILMDRRGSGRGDGTVVEKSG
ncbi:hypothetical protein F5Y16DRAFT_401836 [Xylariaceae sp. FL0255]|nr:hypothetical protein F5Y16DRAFT_401836 [Xylariaceae sp. FL0255]